MRHFIGARPPPCTVSPRPLGMLDPAAAARLVASPGLPQRSPPSLRCAVRAIDLPPVAIATDARLRAALRRGTEKQPPLRRIVVAAPAALIPAALIMVTPVAWTRAVAAAILPLQSCSCTVWGTAPKQNCQVMGRRRAGLAIPQGSYRVSAEFPEPQSVAGPPPDCPGGSTGPSRPLRFAAR